MNIKYSFVCDAANISQEGGLNVLNTFDNINSTQFPCVHPKFMYAACVRFHRSEIGKHKFKLSFIDDDGKEIIPQIHGEVMVADTQLSANMLIEVNGVNFPKPGVYQIDLTVDNQHVSTENINLVLLNLPQK